MSHGLGEGDECQTSALNGLRGEAKQRQEMPFHNPLTGKLMIKSFSMVSESSDLVELILQHTCIQAQLSEAVLLHRLDDAVHLCVVLGGEVGEVDVRGDEFFAQHV